MTVVTSAEFATQNVDKYDVLFVVDDSPSMAQEQQTLQRELPRLVEKLLSGARPDGVVEFPPVKDAHIGVVSADLGSGGLDDALPGCSAWGDDGLLQHAPLADGCADSYPRFLSYVVRHPLASPPSTQSPTTLAADLACIALSGTNGCGYTQPLEAALKALSPSVVRDGPAVNGKPIDPNPIMFLGDRLNDGQLGHGDRYNTDFLRNDPLSGLSLVGIVIVTDKDDCSVSDPNVFVESLDGLTPEARCAAASDRLYPIARYVQGLQAVRSGNEQLVVLSIIAGVPPDLVNSSRDPASGTTVDFDDVSQREAFYGRVLADPRMQVATRADGTLAPACESANASATPSRRLIERARGFRSSVSIVSICDDDWSPAIDPIIPLRTDIHRGRVCLPRPFSRTADGLTSCQVVWELPPPGRVPAGSLAFCDEVPSLLRLHAQRPVTERGGQRCIVHQLAVTGAPENPVIEPGHGWYYDDFSDDLRRSCWAWPELQAIAFSPDAETPSGAVAKIECVVTRYILPTAGEVVAYPHQPDVFEACDPDVADACRRQVQDRLGVPIGDGFDHALSCHPKLRKCMPPCTDGSCPAGWQCNDAKPAWCEPGECRAPG